MSYLNRKDYDNHIHCRTVRWRLNRICDFFGNGGFEFQLGKVMCLHSSLTNIAYTAFIQSSCVATSFVLIIIYYAKFSTLFRQQIKSFQPRSTLTANVEEKRVTKTLGAVMVGFAFCRLPVCIIAAAHRVPTLPRQVHFTYGFLVYLSSDFNPFIYGATNRRFWREGKVILRKVFRQ